MVGDGGDELARRVLEHLGGLARLAVRRVFGGLGLYSESRLFGVVYRGVLYLRADEEMRRDLARHGAGPFRLYRGRAVASFWEVPEALAGEKRRIRALARRALAASEQSARHVLAARAPPTSRLRRAMLASSRPRVPPRRR